MNASKGSEEIRSDGLLCASGDDLASLEREAADADARAAAAEEARGRLAAAQQAHRRRQSEPLRARAEELRGMLAAVDQDQQARLDDVLAEARRLYAERVKPAGEELVSSLSAAGALDGAGWGEREEVFSRWFARNLRAWEERTRWRME